MIIKKPRILALLTVILILALACNILIPTAPAQPEVATIVAVNVQALAATPAAPTLEPANSPAPSSETAVPANVQSGLPLSFQNVTFVIPLGLAESASGDLSSKSVSMLCGVCRITW